MVPAQASFSQLRRGVLEPCVLALLAREEMYGFELVGALQEAGPMLASEGTIYPLLSRLRKRELVTTIWRESSSGPPRRYYRLTSAGVDALASFSVEWEGFRDAVDDLMSASRQRKLVS